MCDLFPVHLPCEMVSSGRASSILRASLERPGLSSRSTCLLNERTNERMKRKRARDNERPVFGAWLMMGPPQRKWRFPLADVSLIPFPSQPPPPAGGHRPAAAASSPREFSSPRRRASLAPRLTLQDPGLGPLPWSGPRQEARGCEDPWAAGVRARLGACARVGITRGGAPRAGPTCPWITASTAVWTQGPS